MKIVIEGAGEVGSHLAKMLREEANDVTVIDHDASRIETLASYADVETILGNPSSIKVQKQAGVDKADLYLAVYPFVPQEVNIVGAILAKKLGAAKVIARVDDEDYLTAENRLLFKELGIELMFYPERSAADEIAEQLRHSASVDTMDFARGKLQISAFKIDENSPVLDLSLEDFTKQLTPEEAEQFRIIALYRGGKTTIPTLETRFRFSDIVYTISKREIRQAMGAHFGKTEYAVRRVMILGGGPIAEMLARTLAKQEIDVKIIEKDREKCIRLSDSLPSSVMIVNGDGRNSDFLFDEGICDYDTFIALSGSDEVNVLACVAAKKFMLQRTIAEVENIEYVKLAEEMGVDSVINKKLITAARIFKFTLSGKARFVKYMSGTDAEVMEYTVAPGSAVTKGCIRDIKFPAGAIIGGVIRGADAFIAVGSTVIEPYDRVAVFSMHEHTMDIDKFFK